MVPTLLAHDRLAPLQNLDGPVSPKTDRRRTTDRRVAPQRLLALPLLVERARFDAHLPRKEFLSAEGLNLNESQYTKALKSEGHLSLQRLERGPRRFWQHFVLALLLRYGLPAEYSWTISRRS